jgi:hypothetical protein
MTVLNPAQVAVGREGLQASECVPSAIEVYLHRCSQGQLRAGHDSSLGMFMAWSGKTVGLEEGARLIVDPMANEPPDGDPTSASCRAARRWPLGRISRKGRQLVSPLWPGGSDRPRTTERKPSVTWRATRPSLRTLQVIQLRGTPCGPSRCRVVQLRTRKELHGRFGAHTLGGRSRGLEGRSARPEGSWFPGR